MGFEQLNNAQDRRLESVENPLPLFADLLETHHEVEKLQAAHVEHLAQGHVALCTHDLVVLLTQSRVFPVVGQHNRRQVARVAQQHLVHVHLVRL